MRIFNTVISESIVNISRNSLDPTVFQFYDDGGEPILQDSIKAQILTKLDSLGSFVNILDFYMVGSILTKKYSKACDIDVNVIVDKERVDEMMRADLLHWVKKYNGELATGTTHPINYYISFDDIPDDKFDAIYDIVNERWIKSDAEVDPDISKIAGKFFDTVSSIDIDTGELKRDLIDIFEIKSLGQSKTIKLRSLIKTKLDNIEENIKSLSNTYENVLQARKDAFNTRLTPHEIKELGSRNNLPENVVYKLLEKYYYLKFLKKINALYKDGRNHRNVNSMRNLASYIGKMNTVDVKGD